MSEIGHTLLWVHWAVVTLLLCGALGAFGRAYYVRRRREEFEQLLRSRYLRLLLFAAEPRDREVVPGFPMLGRYGTRRILCEVIAGLMSVTTGCDCDRLRRVVRAYDLDRWVLRRARYAHGYRCACRLALLSRLPLGEEMAMRVEPFRRSRSAQVRFQALCVQLAADPARAMRRLADYEYPLTPSEVADVLALLRRGVLPIAFEPLLQARPANLRRIGLAVVRLFEIEEAEASLLEISVHDPDPDVAREALQVLCLMRRPMVRLAVAEALSRRTSTERLGLLRAMARAGYAPRTPQKLFEPHECAYYERLVASYKCALG